MKKITEKNVYDGLHEELLAFAVAMLAADGREQSMLLETLEEAVDKYTDGYFDGLSAYADDDERMTILGAKIGFPEYWTQIEDEADSLTFKEGKAALAGTRAEFIVKAHEGRMMTATNELSTYYEEKLKEHGDAAIISQVFMHTCVNILDHDFEEFEHINDEARETAFERVYCNTKEA